MFGKKRVTDLTQAKELFMNHPSPDIYTYNIMINGFAQLGKVAEMEKYFKDLKNKGLQPDIITYTTMMKHQSSKRTNEILNEMKSYNIQPNNKTYLAMIINYVRELNFNLVQKTEVEMRERGIQLDAKMMGWLAEKKKIYRRASVSSKLRTVTE